MQRNNFMKFAQARLAKVRIRAVRRAHRDTGMRGLSLSMNLDAQVVKRPPLPGPLLQRRRGRIAKRSVGSWGASKFPLTRIATTNRSKSANGTADEISL